MKLRSEEAKVGNNIKMKKVKEIKPQKMLQYVISLTFITH